MEALFTLSSSRFTAATGAAPQPAAGGMNTWMDLNGDGWDDLVFTGAFYPNQGSAAQASGQPGWLVLATAQGYAVAPPAQFPGATMGVVHAREIVSADFNGDGAADLFIADHGYDATPFPGHSNHLFLSNGQVGWRQASATLPAQADFTHSTFAADMDRDGDIDLFAGNTVLGQAYVLLNDGRGQFTPDRSALPTGGSFDRLYYESSLLVDLDGDQQPELVLGSRWPDRERQVLWNHGGSWAAGDATALPVPAAVGSAYTVLDIQTTDINFDGRPDLLLNYQTTNGGWLLQLLVNEGGRRFSDRTAELLTAPGLAAGGLGTADVQPSMEFLRPLDLNGDGRMDFFTTPVAVRPASPNRNVPVFLLQREDGRFDTVSTGMLLDAGLEPMLLNGLEYAQRGAPGQGALVIAYQDGSTVQLTSQALQWAAPRSTWHAGTAAADTLTGGAGADWFGPLGGNDRIDGGAGIDRVVYAVPRSAVQLQHPAAAWRASGTATGQDELTGIERLQFSDQHLALDLDGHAGQVARIIGAVFGPALLSNARYVGIGLARLDEGMAVSDLVALAVRTDEFAQLAGGRSNEAFVQQVYRNATGQAPTADEAAYYVGLLARGEHTQTSLAQLAADSELTAARIGLTGLVETGLVYLPEATG